MKNKTVIILEDSEAFDVRELLIAILDTEYGTDSQRVVLVKIIQQIND